jgi:hypothetical protein
MARHPRWVRRFLAEADLDAIVAAVRTAETATSAEIRVHLDARCPGEALARAALAFERLGMHRTAARHGVLLYVSIEDHKLAVGRPRHSRAGGPGLLGQAGRVRPGPSAGSASRRARARGRRAGAVLRQHFPRRPTTSTSCPIG